MRNQQSGWAFRLRAGALVAAVALLSACGGGGGGSSGSSSSSNNNTSNNAPSGPTAVSGVASKGTLKNAIVTAFAIINGSPSSTALAQTRTDATGSYQLALGSYTGPLLVRLTVDGQTTETCDVPAGCAAVAGNTTAFGADFTPPAGLILDTLVAQASGTVVTAITPFTHLAALYALSLGGSAANISTAQAQIQALFNLTDLNATTPLDITASTLTPNDNEQYYSLLDAAIAQLAGSPANVMATITTLSNAIIANNGELKTHGGTAGTNLADVLAAATTVANSTQLAQTLDSQVAVNAEQALTVTNNAAANSLTTVAPPTDTTASDLTKAKTFVSDAHNVLQEVLGLGSTSNVSAVTAAYQPVTNLLQHDTAGSQEVVELADATEVVTGYLVNVASTAAQGSGTATTTYSNTDVASYVGTRFSGANFSVTPNDDVAVVVNPATGVATFNGSMAVQLLSGGVAVGSPVTFTVANMAVNFPSANTVASSYVVNVLAGGTITGATTQLDNSASSGGGTVTLTYTATSPVTLAALAASNQSTATVEQELPDTVAINLNTIVRAAGISSGGSTTYQAVFTGGFGITAGKGAFQTADTTSVNTRYFLAPKTLSLNGQITGLNGDFATVTATASIEGTPPLTSQTLVSPDSGHVVNNLFVYAYAASHDTATLSLNPAVNASADWFWSQQPAAGITLSLVPSTSSIYCNSENAVMATNSNGGSWFMGCTTATTLPVALTDLDLGSTSSTEANPFDVNLTSQGIYYGVLPSFASQGVALNGTLGTSDNTYVQSANYYAVGTISAQVQAQVTVGTTVHTVNLKIMGSKTSFNGGNATVTFTVDSQPTLTLQAPSITAGSLPALVLSDSSGALVDASIVSGSKTLQLLVNGSVQGQIFVIGGVYVARFSDNSLMAL